MDFKAICVLIEFTVCGFSLALRGSAQDCFVPQGCALLVLQQARQMETQNTTALHPFLDITRQLLESILQPPPVISGGQGVTLCGPEHVLTRIVL